MKICLFILFIFMSGCSTIQATYVSEPLGAAIYEGENLLGYAPLTIKYELSDLERQNGKKIINNIYSIWASGAKLSINEVILYVSSGYEQAITITRPNVPGREIDVKYALEMQKMILNAALEKKHIEREEQRHREIMRIEQKKLYEMQRPKSSMSTIFDNRIYTNTW
jgi:uncharacterized protein (UPF0297 family)